MKKVLVISDLSCTGRASIMVADAVLSALGHCVSALPTELLSSQTGGVSDYARTTSTTPFIKAAGDSFVRRQLTFDCIMTGWLADCETAKWVSEFVGRVSNPDTILAVDPVLGDDGRFYAGFDREIAKIIKTLMARADYVKPNLTELNLLCGATEEDKAAELAKNVLLSGVEKDGKIGVRFFGNRNFTILADKVEGFFHGAGDVFFAAFVGLKLNDATDEDALSRAVKFVTQSIAYSKSIGTEPTQGVVFEPFLRSLID